VQETRSKPTSSGKPVRHSSDTPETVQNPKPLDRLRDPLRSRRFSRRTEATYCQQFRWFLYLGNTWTRFTLPLPPICLKMAMTSRRSIHLPQRGDICNPSAGKILHFRKNPPLSALCELNYSKNDLILRCLIVIRWGYDFCFKKNKGLSVKSKSAEILGLKTSHPSS
jgi:hypothetical protein